MSNRNTDTKYRENIESMEFVLQQFRKTIYTALPATIESYDAETKRAKLVPAIKSISTDNKSSPLPALVDVPVIFPASGAFTMHFPLAAGDAVLVVFSQRGIQNFKQDYQSSNPTNENVVDYDSPIAIAGFGAISFTPAETNSASLQTNDGKNAVIIGESDVSLKLDKNSVTVSSSDIKLSVGTATAILTSSLFSSSVPIAAPDFTSSTGSAATFSQGITTPENVVAGSISLRTHVHGGVTTGDDSTGVPV